MPEQLRKLVAIPIMAAILLVGSPAMAQLATESEQGTQEGTLTSILGALTTYLPAIESAISASTAATGQAASAEVTGAGQINDALEATQWSLMQAYDEGESANDAAATVAGCQPATGSRAVVSNDIPNRIVTSNMVTGMMNRMGNAPGTNTQYGTFAGLTQDAAYKINTYGNSNEICPGSVCTTAAMPDADVRADTLFQDTYITGTPIGAGAAPPTTPTGNPVTIQATLQQWEQAASDYCVNLTNTLNPDQLQNNLLSSQQGIPAFSMRKAADARMSLTQMVCSEMVAEREPNTNSSWGQQIQSNLVGYYGLPASGLPTNNFSSYQLMKLQANDQFADPHWEQNLESEPSPASALRLMNTLEAASLQLQWQEYDSLERIKLLEAVSLASKVEKTRQNVPTTALPAQ